MIKLHEKGVRKSITCFTFRQTFCGSCNKERGQVGKIMFFINLQNKFSMLQWKCLPIAMQ